MPLLNAATLTRLLALALVASPATALGRNVAAGVAGAGSVPERTAAPARTELTFDGPILVTPGGVTLYAFASENTRSDKFRWQCASTPPRIMTDGQTAIGERAAIGAQHQKSCVQKNPPYLAAAAARPVGEFDLVTRPEGTRQWTYQGAPLYTSVKDGKPGDRFGTGGYQNAWGFVVDGREAGGLRLVAGETGFPRAVRFMRRGSDMVLAGAVDGRPLYTPKGKPGRTQQSDFEPLLAPAIARLDGDWSLVEAGAGRKQYAFRGKPLYTAPLSMTEYEIAAAGGWDVVPFYKPATLPREIRQHMTLTGEVYTDKQGRTLYVYGCVSAVNGGPTNNRTATCDDRGDPAGPMVALCGDAAECARRWLPYLADAKARPSGDWSVVDMTYPMFTDPRGTLFPPDAPSVKVWAYRGRPVYRFHEDEKPGDIWGDKTKGLWGSYFVVARVPGQGAIY